MPVDGRPARRATGPGRGPSRLDGHPAGVGHASAAGHAATVDRPAAPARDHGREAEATRAVATSPAVGFFRPRRDLAVGARVRAGDRLGTVDVLGVPQELVAPADGVVGATVVEPGDPVEYGQPIVEIELLAQPITGGASQAPDGEHADAGGAG